jgi:hypothetical protein
MDCTIIISSIIRSMREYQKKYNIKGQCITNTQYLYDIIKNYTNDVKTKAVYVISENKEENIFTLVGSHMVLVLDDDTCIDPSYEIFCLKNKSYYNNFENLMSNFNDKSKNILKEKFDLKKIISEHIRFKKISNEINNGEFFLSITGKEYYNKQADYVEKEYQKELEKIKKELEEELKQSK